MSSLAFVTHPSVRIKGTENSYTPTQCIDELCPVKAPHLHCPFCVKTDAYQDPVILKAHYRVKHVDKGIDFAGLKILRCCDQCDIIGIIKGEKRFKGAHWHCYRCRNGFNRRDEAIKHYKTHFRNPQTTFQIQITQDLNSPPIIRPPTEEHTASTQDVFASLENSVQEIIHPALSQTVSMGVGEQNVITAVAGTNCDQKIKVKHEPPDTDLGPVEHEDQHTIMIIQGDQLESALASHIINSGDLSVLSKSAVDASLTWEIRYRMEEEEKNMYKAKAQEYKAQMELLQQQVSELEAQLSQQMTVQLQEMVTSLNTAPDTNKQALGLQLAKVLEQCQSYPTPGTAPTTVSLQSAGLSNSLSHQQHQELEHLDQLQNPVEAAVPLVQNIDGSGSSPQSIMTSNLNLPTSMMPHLSEIPEGYHIVSTTPEGHLVISKTSELTVRTESVILSSRDTVVGKPGSIGVSLAVSDMSAVDENKHSLIDSDGGLRPDIQSSVSGSIQEAISESIRESISESIKESVSESIQESISESCIQDSKVSSLLNDELQQAEDNHLCTVASEETSLLHVVTTTDELTSMGVVCPADGDTFVMDIEGSQGLLVQKEVLVGETFENTAGQRRQHTVKTLDRESTVEPSTKKIRLAT